MDSIDGGDCQESALIPRPQSGPKLLLTEEVGLRFVVMNLSIHSVPLPIPHHPPPPDKVRFLPTFKIVYRVPMPVFIDPLPPPPRPATCIF